MKKHDMNVGLQRLIESYSSKDRDDKDERFAQFLKSNGLDESKNSGLKTRRPRFSESLEDNDYYDFVDDVARSVQKTSKKWQARGISYSDIVDALNELALKFEESSKYDEPEDFDEAFLNESLSSRWRVSEIQYDIDEDDFDDEESLDDLIYSLPDTMTITLDGFDGTEDEDEIEEALADEISDRTGWAVIDFVYSKKEDSSLEEALSDEQWANNAMIRKILNKRPSRLTASEKEFLAKNRLFRTQNSSNVPIVSSDHALVSVDKNSFNGMADNLDYLNKRAERNATSRTSGGYVISDYDDILNQGKRRRDELDAVRSRKDWADKGYRQTLHNGKLRGEEDSPNTVSDLAYYKDVSDRMGKRADAIHAFSNSKFANSKKSK